MVKGKENLIPVTKRTKDEAREISRKGGKASGKARRAKKTMAQIAEKILALSLKSAKDDVVDVDDANSLKELAGENISVQTAMVLALTKNALEGDCKSIDMLLTLTGQKVEKQELQIKSDTPLSQTLIYLPDNGRDN